MALTADSGRLHSLQRSNRIPDGRTAVLRSGLSYPIRAAVSTVVHWLRCCSLRAVSSWMTSRSRVSRPPFTVHWNLQQSKYCTYKEHLLAPCVACSVDNEPWAEL